MLVGIVESDFVKAGSLGSCIYVLSLARFRLVILFDARSFIDDREKDTDCFAHLKFYPSPVLYQRF